MPPEHLPTPAGTRDQPSARPTRGRHAAEDWEVEESAGGGVSADERLRQMQMRVASARRTGVSAGSHWGVTKALPTGDGGRTWRLLGVAGCVLLGLVALAALAVLATRKPEASSLPKPPAKLPAATPQSMAQMALAAAGADDSLPKHGRWVPVEDAEAAPVVEWINRFLETPAGQAKRAMMRPTPELNARLAAYAGHPLLGSLPQQRIASKIFFADNGLVSADVNILGYGFRPVVLLPAPGGDYQVDLDGFLGHNGFDWLDFPKEMEEKSQLVIRTIAVIEPKLVAKVPGDVILAFRDAEFGQTYHAHLSTLDVPESYIVTWLSQGLPLAFTLTVVSEDTLFGPILRVRKLEANAWFFGEGDLQLKVTP
jgi:hypothetical protein